jgi:hypothetical protein
MLRLELLARDEGVQSRTRLDDETVAHYSELMAEGEEFPPLAVFDDGERLWLADGFHRAEAASESGLEEYACEVRKGTRRDAVLYAVGANARHGLPRTSADKRRAVRMLLADEEWSQWSDTEIARSAGVSKTFVSKMRRRHQPEAVGTKRLARRGRQVYPMTPGQQKATPQNCGLDYAARWLFYLVRFTPRQFVQWKEIVNGRTDLGVLGNAVETVMKVSWN